MNDGGSLVVEGGVSGARAATGEGCPDNDLGSARATGKSAYRRFVRPGWLSAGTNLAVIAGLVVAGLLLAS